jgi:hypothetical protein
MSEDKIDFLGIGAPRSGTSWLWTILGHHPDIWMPPRKELHYFDRSLKYSSPSFLADDTFIKRMLGIQPSSNRFRTTLIRDLAQLFLRGGNWRDLKWILRYFLGTINDNWYISLFKTGGDKVKGEITPAYCLLDSTDVRHVKELFPDLKLIYLLRNPVERAWSGLRFNWTLGKFKDMNQPEKVKTEAEHLSHAPRGEYIRTISTWKAFFPEKNFFIGFYDDIVLNPQDLIKRVFEFLGVDSVITLPEELLYRKINAAKYSDMPKDIARIFAKNYLPEVENLNALFQGYPTKWLTDIQDILQQ